MSTRSTGSPTSSHPSSALKIRKHDEEGDPVPWPAACTTQSGPRRRGGGRSVKAHIPLEVSVLTRIRDQCIQARCTVDGPTPSVYYRGAPYSNTPTHLAPFRACTVRTMHKFVTHSCFAVPIALWTHTTIVSFHFVGGAAFSCVVIALQRIAKVGS